MFGFSKIIYIFAVVTILALSIVALVISTNQVQQKTVELNTYALYGGSIEKGYPFAGFLIMKKTDGNWNTCSGFFVDSVTMYTARHCVNGTLFGYGGQGEFTFSLQKLNRIAKIETSPATINLDIAKVIFAKPTANPPFGRISDLGADPCAYTVVAYGYSSESPNFPGVRKSAPFCITDKNLPFMFLKSVSGGACFGDSGSPIIKTGTSEVVGISSQLVGNQCAPGTTMVGLTLQNNNANLTSEKVFDTSLYTNLESKYLSIPVAKISTK